MARALLIGPLLAGALALTACGGGGTATGPVRPPVRLDLDGPADDATVHTAAVEVHGRVRPVRAVVRVRGVRTPVRGGAFTAQVALDPGVNVIDVIASAGRTRPAITAIRVRREVVVTVPDLAGESPGAAAGRLRDAGLRSRRQDDGGLFDNLVPDDPVVCSTDPDAGRRVPVGSTVVLLTARLC